MKKGDKVKLTKLSDDKFEGKHPNDINQGFSIEGTLRYDIDVGLPIMLDKVKHDYWEWFHTSTITDIIDEHTFKTLNSTYRVESL